MDKLRGARLLLVEDNDLNQELATELLRNAGVEVVIAGHGREALDILAADQAFDGILMDCQMPVMDGYTATREIRALPGFAMLPIIAMTANAMAGDREKVLAAGMFDHIAKPLNVAEMFETLAKWITPTYGSAAPTAANAISAPDVVLPTLPGVDTQSGLARTMGDGRLYRKLLLKFREGYADFSEAFGRARRDDDPTAATRVAHTLKGTAGNIGAIEVQRWAGELERACSAGAAPAEIERLLAATAAALQVVVDGLGALASHAAAAPAPSDGAADTARLKALIDRLAALLEDSDMAAAEVAEQLAEAARGTPLADPVGRIARAVAEYDFDPALEAVRKVAAQVGA
jgi:CheY-like chemotaxis protein